MPPERPAAPRSSQAFSRSSTVRLERGEHVALPLAGEAPEDRGRLGGCSQQHASRHEPSAEGLGSEGIERRFPLKKCAALKSGEPVLRAPRPKTPYPFPARS